MGESKSMIMTVRVHPEVKERLWIAAEQEWRSLTHMIEVMICHYCDQAEVHIAETGTGTKVA